jgi:hypothetical protein
MNLPQKSVAFPLLISLLSMPFWFFLTEPYVTKASPLKLYETIHPTYYIGLAALILSITILSVRAKENSYCVLNPYLITAILATFYSQLPSVALFEHPVSDHTIHLVPAFYMLREGNIYMPNYPQPETVTPQLFASIFIMITSISNPLENLNRISVFLLSLLTTLYIYIFMRRLGVSGRYAMMASVLNMGLIYFSFMFLRQTYAMPLYIMLGLLILVALKGKKASFSILAIITSAAFVMSDPAHVILTIIPLTLFAVAWFAVRSVGLASKASEREEAHAWIFAILLSIMFFFWIISSSPRMPISLWNIATHMWDVFVKSITEFAYPLSENPTYWGKSGALAFNGYYASLYRVSVILKVVSIALPAISLTYVLLNKKTRPIVFRPETLFLTSYFLITAIVIVGRGYGFTYTPWAVMIMFYWLSIVLKGRSPYKISSFLLISIMMLSIVSVTFASHYINVRGSFTTADICLSEWLGANAPQGFHVEIPFEFYEWWQNIAYIRLGNCPFTVSWYIPYGGLSPKIVNELTEYKCVVLADTSIRFFQELEDVSSIPEFSVGIANELSIDYNLVYASGYPFNTVWFK